jgi:hypothetical protein
MIAVIFILAPPNYAYVRAASQPTTNMRLCAFITGSESTENSINASAAAPRDRNRLSGQVSCGPAHYPARFELVNAGTSMPRSIEYRLAEAWRLDTIGGGRSSPIARPMIDIADDNISFL